MLRDVDSAKIQKALREAFAMNGYGDACKSASFVGAFNNEEIKEDKADVCAARDDTTPRSMVVSFNLGLPKGQSVAGFGSGRVTVDLTISDLNQPQTITAPKNAQPFSQLQDQLKGVVSGLQGQTPSASGSSGSGSSGSGAADAPGASTTATPSSKYLTCLQKAGSDLGAVQKCASLVGQ